MCNENYQFALSYVGTSGRSSDTILIICSSLLNTEPYLAENLVELATPRSRQPGIPDQWIEYDYTILHLIEIDFMKKKG